MALVLLYQLALWSGELVAHWAYSPACQISQDVDTETDDRINRI